MVVLTKQGLENADWRNTGIQLPQFSIEEMLSKTRESPTWVHIAPGNLYVAEVAPIQQALLELGAAGEGIIGIEAWDEEIIDKIYHPHDNLRLNIVMPLKGDNQITLIASTSDSLYADISRPRDWSKALEYFAKPSLQMATITCTEKGYRTHD